MTWTKLGDEFSAEASDLTDAEHRTHVDALGWSNRRLLDLRIPKRDVRRFAESPDSEQAVDGLVSKGWWTDNGDDWFIGVFHPEWQLERTVVLKRREAAALRQRRSRMHRAGDHSLCLAEHCPYVTRDIERDSTGDIPRDSQGDSSRDPVRVGSDRGYAPPEPS